MGDIMDVFYFIGYTESALERIKTEMSKLSLDPARWSKADKVFISTLAAEAANALHNSVIAINTEMTDEEISKRMKGGE